MQLSSTSVSFSNLTELFELGCVFLEAIADSIGEELCQTRIGLVQPAAVCDTVGDVLELVGGIVILVVEH